MLLMVYKYSTNLLQNTVILCPGKQYAGGSQLSNSTNIDHVANRLIIINTVSLTTLSLVKKVRLHMPHKSHTISADITLLLLCAWL